MSDDLEAIAADDRRIERLRRALTPDAALSPDAAVVWGDDDDDTDDAGVLLLRALQDDVRALPEPARLADVVPLRRQRLRRGVAVAAVTAGVLSFAGVAAAATGLPLDGVRSAVASAVHHVVDAVVPGRQAGPADTATASTPTATLTPPGEAVSAAARAAATQQQVQRLLGRAADLLAAGHVTAARAVLGTAARTVNLLDAGQREAYRQQITALYATSDALVAEREQQAKPHQPGTRPGAPATHATAAPGSAPAGRPSTSGRTAAHASQHDAPVQPVYASHGRG